MIRRSQIDCWLAGWLSGLLPCLLACCRSWLAGWLLGDDFAYIPTRFPRMRRSPPEFGRVLQKRAKRTRITFFLRFLAFLLFRCRSDRWGRHCTHCARRSRFFGQNTSPLKSNCVFILENLINFDRSRVFVRESGKIRKNPEKSGSRVFQLGRIG